jgi:hypothetical protein
MIRLENLRDSAAELFGAISHGFEEFARSWLAAEEVRRLGDDPIHAVWRCQCDLEGNHGAVAVSPQRNAPELKGVEHAERLIRGTLVEVQWLDINGAGPPVPGSIGHNYAMPIERRHLAIERVNPGPPSTVQHHDHANPIGLTIVRGIPIADSNRQSTRGKW